MKDDGWATYSDMDVLPAGSDRFHFGLQRDAVSGPDRLARRGDEPAHVGRGRPSRVDEIIRVHRGDLRRAGSGALEAGGFDQAPRGPRPGPARGRWRIG